MDKTPKEKARELCDKFASALSDTEHAQKCALISCEELINSECEECGKYHNMTYWEEVKLEIEKL